MKQNPKKKSLHVKVNIPDLASLKHATMDTVTKLSVLDTRIYEIEKSISVIKEALLVMMTDLSLMSHASDIAKSSAKNESDNLSEDELYAEACKIVRKDKKASTSHLQRKLGIGYSRAAKIMDRLEEENVIGPINGSKPREIN